MFLHGLGTAHPEHRFTKQQCWDAFEQSVWFGKLDRRARAIAQAVLTRDNGIESRHLAVDTLAESFQIDPDTLHARFLAHAPTLGTLAAERALAEAMLDATQIDALSDQINTNAGATIGIRQRCIAGSVDTLSPTNTISTGRNSARTEIVWSEKSPWTGAELAANQAGIVTLFETKPNPRTNFAFFGNDAVSGQYWVVPRPRLDSAIPSRTNIKSALNNGVSPIGINPNGTTYLVNRITTRSLNGSTNDYRIRDAHKVTICDFFGEDLLAKFNLQFPGMRIMDDAPDGAPQPGPNVLTPRRARNAVFGLIDVYEGNDLLQDVALIKAGTIVQRETSPRTRLGIRIPIRTVDNFYQAALQVNQVA